MGIVPIFSRTVIMTKQFIDTSMLTESQAKVMQMQEAGLPHQECAEILGMTIQEYTAALTIATSILGVNLTEFV